MTKYWKKREIFSSFDFGNFLKLMTFFFRAYADNLWFLISWFMTNYWKKRPKLFLILIDKKTVGFTQSPFFSTTSNNLTNFFPLFDLFTFFGNFLQFLASFLQGLYRGFTISCVGIFIYRGMYFGLYDSLKPILLGADASVLWSFLLGWGVTIFSGTYFLQII